MKPTLRSLLYAAITLSILCAQRAVGRADDATDYANQLAQAQKEREEAQAQREQAQRERDEWQAQLAQAQKDREDRQAQLDQAQRDRDALAQAQKEREDWQNQMYQAQKDRDDWFKAQKERDDWLAQQAQAQKEREDWQNQLYQAQKERNDYIDQITRANMEGNRQSLSDYLKSIQDGIDRVVQQRDELLNRGDPQPGAWAAESTPQAPPPQPLLISVSAPKLPPLVLVPDPATASQIWSRIPEQVCFPAQAVQSKTTKTEPAADTQIWTRIPQQVWIPPQAAQSKAPAP